MKRNLMIIFFYCLIPLLLWGQMVSDTSFFMIEGRLLSKFEVYPQEKIHLHTDRDYYVPGEKIWFKAYLVDAVSYQYPTYSRYVYVELIRSDDSLVRRVMIRTENDMFFGHIFLSEILPESNYTLRAYTRYMENLGDDYFFKKNIRIGNLNVGNRENVENSGNRVRIQDDFEVSFFPEGGNLVEGAFCKVAFKALNRNGYPESISGTVVDENENVITSVETFHAGIGVFSYIPEEGKKYSLKCRNGNGLEKQFELPQANPSAISLTVSQRNKRLSVEVRKSAQSSDNSYYFLAHCRGMVFHFSMLNKDNELIAFSEEDLPSGIIQLVCFDEQMNPLSERLVFNKKIETTKVKFLTDKESYEKREKVKTTLSLSPSLVGRAGDVAGHFSVAITDDNDISIDSTTTILSTLLLSSELKGYIENPAYYLQDNIESVIALDYIMLTHGWRRYNIPEVVKGNQANPQIPFQESQKISGMVKSLVRNRPVADSEVLMMSKDGEFGITLTSDNGTFLFDGFEHPDSTSYFIQALSRKGSTLVELVLDDESFPKPVHAPQSPYFTPALSKGEGEREGGMEETKSEPETDAFIVKAKQRSRYDDAMRVIHLSEIEVTAPRIVRKDEARRQFWANSSSDVTLRRDEIERSSPRLVSDMLRRVAGVNVASDGYISIRGSRSLPLLFFDGMQVDWPTDMRSPYDSPLESINIREVESIDIFNGAGASVFGVRGAGGAISITTKRDIEDFSREESNYTVYTPLGYQKPVEFYSPNYESLESKHLTIPDYRTTIFWKPDIVIDDSGEASFEFYTSDFSTTYSVVIEGIAADGKIIRQVEKIRVE